MSAEVKKEISKPSELFLSVIIAAITGLFITSSIGPAMVQPLLLDGSLISNGRFAFVYDAYDTIEDDDVPSIIGIGSSILMAGMNGTCMQGESSIENARFYNMAMSGGKPYSEMLQIPALIESKPDIVMVEIGPNSLYGWDSTQYVNGITDYNEFRFQLMSMGMEKNQIGDWYEVLDPVDKQWIETNRFGKLDAWSEYTRDAIEEYLIREIDDLTNALDETSYSYVPPVGTDTWDNYLSEPNWRTSKFDSQSSTEIREYLDEKMPSKSKQGVYNPKSNDTQNHNALDYMINSLVNASIKVVLVGIPHHPWVNEYLEPGQLDGMNLTYQRYESIEGVYPLQMYFEEWPSEAFSDRNHLDAEGREVFCKRVTPIIDAVYFDDNLSDVFIESSVFEIPDSRGICVGSNQSFPFHDKIIHIEAENYSSCTYGEEYINSKWEQKVTFENYSGQTHMSALPDSKSKTGDSIDGPELTYNITNLDSGSYHLWIRMAAPDGGGDSIHVGLDGIPITYGGVGLSTHPIGEWNWEYISINVTSNDYTQLSIWMREDGVMIDSLILTSVEDFDPYISENLEPSTDCIGSNITFSTDLTFSEDQGLIIIEAEDYTDCSHGSDAAENSIWELDTNFSGYTGQGYMEATPDNKVKTGDLTFGPHLKYNLSIPAAGVYHLWIRLAASDGGGDSIHVGLNGISFTYGGVGLSTSANSQWNWELISLNITSAGFNQLDIWMREDGIKIDSLVVATDSDFVP